MPRDSRLPEIQLSAAPSPSPSKKQGFSRVVRCNDPAAPSEFEYPSNAISTTKYTTANFVPKSLFEQFRRVANLFFLVVGLVSLTPLAPYRAVTVLLPLVVVVGATMAKEAIEDWQRKRQDVEVNNRKVKVYDAAYSFNHVEWEKLRVGDIIKVDKDDFFPADLVFLSSSNEDGTCYVETMNLDGETNLKLKSCLETTSTFQTEASFQKFSALIECEDPNEKLYSFIGSLHHEGFKHSLCPDQILLRDSKLRNTQYIYGVVIFTGHDTKVMKNAMEPPSKRSNIEKRMDKIIYVLFACLVTLVSVGSVFFLFKTKGDLKDGKFNRWYLRPDKSSVFFDSNRAYLAAFFHFLTGLMLYGCLIPISLYISIEIVKVLQSNFINQDREMYCEESDKPARARTSNLNEELGQVHTIMSDKTGTLTCNSMEFVKCSIAGVSYGSGGGDGTEILRKGSGQVPEPKSSIITLEEYANYAVSRKPVKGFKFWDDRLMNGRWINEESYHLIHKFFQALAVCHTAVPEVNDKTAEVSYEAESPDEAAFVIAAREFGFEFYNRTPTSLSLREFDATIGRKVDRSYKLLNVLEFNSARKRMSVVVRNEDGQILLFCKGADSVILRKLSKAGQLFEADTKSHISEYSEAGFRTLVVAYRELSEEEHERWNRELVIARTAVTADRSSMIDAIAEKIERDLILLGATAVEDRLQKGVPECINKLAQGGIKLWILTGDKLETAVNIGHACNLLRQGMKQIAITLDNPHISSSAKESEIETLEKDSYQSITNQLQEARDQVHLAKECSTPCAFIIDGNSLGFALSGCLENLFMDLAINCASVICCRISPKQKALVTRLAKQYTRKTILAVGDGANDVGMLQEADIGVGISGAEGMQAVMASDFAIAQFRFLERLIFVHGHWCYRRIAAMICYFFYKNIAFGFTLFCLEAHASFSGQPAYNDWYISFYNVLFTSLPVIALGIFDKDISARLCLKFPLLHEDGIRNTFFSWSRILGWMLNGACSSIIIFYFTSNSILNQAFREDGRVAGLELLGTTMYTCVIWTVNCQMALYISYFTWIQQVFVWGSIICWYLFLVIYGFFPPGISTNAYRVFVEACASSPSYWLTMLLVVISALLPYFCYSTVQTTLFPKKHDIIKRATQEDPSQNAQR